MRLKETIYAWVVALFFAFCIAGCVHLLFAQDKAKDVKLSGIKVVERLQQIEKAIIERQKKIIADDPECQRLEFLYRGLVMAFTDTTLTSIDTTKQVKKK